MSHVTSLRIILFLVIVLFLLILIRKWLILGLWLLDFFFWLTMSVTWTFRITARILLFVILAFLLSYNLDFLFCQSLSLHWVILYQRVILFVSRLVVKFITFTFQNSFCFFQVFSIHTQFLVSFSFQLRNTLWLYKIFLQIFFLLCIVLLSYSFTIQVLRLILKSFTWAHLTEYHWILVSNIILSINQNVLLFTL